MARIKMKKAEMLQRVLDLVIGKKLTPTDVRLAYVDEIESASRNGEITAAQRQNWYPTQTELKKLSRATEMAK